MCSKISWHQFLSVLIFLIIAYWIGIISIYYHKDILKWFYQKLKGSNPIKKESLPAFEPANAAPTEKPPILKPTTKETKESKIYTAVHEFTHDLNNICSDGNYRQAGKPEIIAAIKEKLTEFPILQGSDLEREIMQYIATNVKDICSIDLSKEELNMLWKGE